MPKAKFSTWTHYFRHVSPRMQLPEDEKSRFLDHTIVLHPNQLPVFYHSAPFIYVLDYITGKFIRLSEAIEPVLGFPASYIMAGGIEFLVEQFDKEHLELFNEQVFPDRLEFLQNIPPAQHADYIFSYRLCLLNSKGEKVHLLHRNSYLSSELSGKPVMSCGLLLNIEHFSRPNPIIQVVEKIDRQNLAAPPELAYKKTYFLDDALQSISKREREILLYMSEGLTSKQIAEKLFIAEGTVINHRKHMMEKTGMLNVAALICFALRRGII